MGSYFCICPRGYITSTDGSRCIGKPYIFEISIHCLFIRPEQPQQVTTIIQLLGEWLREFLKIYGVIIEGLVRPGVLYKDCSFQSHLGVFLVVILVWKKDFLKTLLLPGTRHKGLRMILKNCL